MSTRSVIFWVGLDVHKDSITAAVLRGRDPEPLGIDRIANEPKRIRRYFERPHESLDMQLPSELYKPSERALPSNPTPIEYPGHFAIRRVSGDHTMRWNNRKVFVSTLLEGRKVGLEPIGDGVFAVYFGPLRLGWLDEVDYRIMDVKERTKRCR